MEISVLSTMPELSLLCLDLPKVNTFKDPFTTIKLEEKMTSCILHDLDGLEGK